MGAHEDTVDINLGLEVNRAEMKQQTFVPALLACDRHRTQIDFAPVPDPPVEIRVVDTGQFRLRWIRYEDLVVEVDRLDPRLIVECELPDSIQAGPGITPQLRTRIVHRLVSGSCCSRRQPSRASMASILASNLETDQDRPAANNYPVLIRAKDPPQRFSALPPTASRTSRARRSDTYRAKGRGGFDID